MKRLNIMCLMLDIVRGDKGQKTPMGKQVDKFIVKFFNYTCLIILFINFVPRKEGTLYQ